MEDPTDESEPPYGRGYGARKALCEQELIDAFGEDRSVIVRPGEISGPGDPTDRVRYWLRRVELGGEILVPGDPSDPVQHIDARDLSGWIVRLLEQEESGPYNAVGPEAPLTWAEFVYAVRAQSNSNLSFTWVAEDFLAERELTGRYVFPWVPAGLRSFAQVNHTRALATGLTYLPLADTLGDMMEELRSAGSEGIEPSLFGRLGVSAAREGEVLDEWHDLKGTG
jgi:2'-hydroxyisoflavone reductase